ncbi:MAG: hypothetical protein WC254_03405 [Candidatus Woesearchaeota archaeon]
MSFSLHTLLLGLFAQPIQPTELVVNTDPHHYSANISQEQGEIDLSNIAKQEPTNDWREELWYYVETTDGKTQWYEAGIDEKYNSVEPDKKITEKLLRKSNEISKIVDYHIHPKEFPECNYVSLPSMFDSMNEVRGAQKFMEKNSNIHYESRIVTSNGMFVINYSPEVVNEEIAVQTIQTQMKPSTDAIVNPTLGNYDLIARPIEDSKRFAAAITSQYAPVAFIPQ